MIKKFFVIFLLFISIFISGMKGVYAYEFPDNSYYVKIRDAHLGEITLYVPYDKISFLSLQEDNQIINVGSSSVTAYTSYNGNDLSISFNVFQFGRYRINSSGNYTYLDIQQIIDTNINFLQDQSMFVSNNYDVLSLSFMLIGGVLLFLIWLKR